jgi:hypothetical protein
MSGENAEFLFVARLRENGAPWVLLQPKHEGLTTLKGEIGLDLYLRPEQMGQDFPRGVLARFLNSNIKSVS